VAAQAQHVRDDLLRLGGVLRAAVHEHLPGLVDLRDRHVRLEGEVLLPAELELAAEAVGGAGQPGLRIAPGDDRLRALELLGRDRLAEGEHRGQRLVVDLHRSGAEPGGLEALAEHPAHGVAVEHRLGGEERLVLPHAGVVDARHVGGGEHAHHARQRERRLGAECGDAGVRVRALQRPRVERPRHPRQQVVGVEGGAGDVQLGALVRDGAADDRMLGALGQGGGHQITASAWRRSSDCSSMALR
jgi:hypothetical protein